MIILREIRCKCNKLLAKQYPPGEYKGDDGEKATYDSCTAIPYDVLGDIEAQEIDKDNVLLEIKCPKCGELNSIEV